MKLVYQPFDTPVYRDLNPHHPLLSSLWNRSYDDFAFVGSSPDDFDAQNTAGILRQAASFSEQLQAGRSDILRSGEQQMKFIMSRDLGSQLAYDTSADLAFLHTVPMIIHQMPYVLHFESLTTLFHPFMSQGTTSELRLRDEHVFWYVRTMLESDLCRGLFTNLSSSVAHAEKSFESDIIAGKLRHVPPGPYYTSDEADRVAASVESKRTKQHINILFTNSWHQAPGNFFLRGGFDLILAFLEIERAFPNVRLTLRTVLPDQLSNFAPQFGETVCNHPKITVLPNKVSDEELFDLFLDADIFCLNAAGVHSVSVLRAMYCGAACVVSDVSGYDDYLTHDESGLVLPGLKAEIYSEEPETGWLRDDYAPMYQFSGARVKALASALHRLCENSQLRLALGRNARQRAMQQNNFTVWKDGFESVIRDALGLSE